MPYKCDYIYANRIIIMYAYGMMQIEEFRELTHAANRLMDEGTSPIHVLNTFNPNAAAPKNLQSIAEIMKSVGNFHPNAGWIIQVTDNPVQRFIGTLVVQMVYKQVRHSSAANPTQALQFIKQRDSSLETLDVEAVAAACSAFMQPAQT